MVQYCIQFFKFFSLLTSIELTMYIDYVFSYFYCIQKLINPLILFYLLELTQDIACKNLAYIFRIARDRGDDALRRELTNSLMESFQLNSSYFNLC